MVFLSLAAVSSGTVEDAVDHISDGYDYQRELPPIQDSAEGPIEDIWDAIVGTRRQRSGPNVFMRSASAVTSVLPWIAIAVLVGLAIVALGQRLTGPRDRFESLPAMEATPSSAPSQRNLPEPGELARSGFNEAIHALLLHAFRTVSANLRWVAEVSDTSREVMSEVPLRQEARDLLGVLVSAVESTRFAGVEASESTFVECQQAFEQLREACSRATS